MIIYCNGDSFVAGSELADFELPDHPGYFSELPAGRTKSVRADVDNWLKTVKCAPEYKYHLNGSGAHRALAFPNKIKQSLDVNVINEARGGQSMDSIVRRTTAALIKLLSTTNKTDNEIIAIIGTTEMSRFEMPIAYINPDKPSSNQWQSVIPAYELPDSPPGSAALIKYMVMHDTDYHQYVRYYQNIIHLQDFCKLNGIALYWISALSYDGSPHELGDSKLQNLLSLEATPEQLHTLVTYANFTRVVDMQESSTKISTDKRYCADGHFVEEVHTIVANELCELILKEHA